MSNEIIATAQSPAVKNIFLKRDLLANGDSAHSKIRTGIFAYGGCMWGVFSAGVVVGLEQHGLTDTFDYGFGFSAGATVLAYFLARQSRLGAGVMTEELSHDFIDFRHPDKIINIDRLKSVINGDIGQRKLDVEAVRASRTDLHINTTNQRSGRSWFFRAQDPKTPLVEVLKASASMPILYNRSVKINHIPFVDGALSHVCIDDLIKKYQLTDVLVLLNTTADYRTSQLSILIETILSQVYMRRHNSLIKDALYDRHKSDLHNLEHIWEHDAAQSGVNLSVLCMDKPKISQFSQDSRGLHQLADEGTRKALHLA